ncbi:MAG: hypothetical protein RIS76_1098 [Verrucomicrobiota bacterium]
MRSPTLRRHGGRHAAGRARGTSDEPPLRAEVLTSGQLDAYAGELAAGHRVVLQGGANGLLARLNENEELLHAFNRATLEIRRHARDVTPAAEWLLDNAYLLDEQVLLARRHLPRQYSRELPRLAVGGTVGLPRVYDLVLEYVAHVDAQLELTSLSALVTGYQRVSPLRLGELWAVPIMLRLGLLENLRRVTVRLSEARADRNLALHWAERLQAVLETDASDLIVIVAELARGDLPRSIAFVAEFSQRLSRFGPSAQLARNWFEGYLAREGRSLEQYVLMESQRQAADQVSISHSIASLRLLGTLDWRSFVEALSVVELALRQDPAGIYARMDFATRDQYRHAVEAVARGSKRRESEIADLAISLSTEQARVHGANDRRAHVGYHLIDAGRKILETAVHLRCPWRAWPERLIRCHPAVFYIGGLTSLALGATAVLGWAAFGIGIHGLPLALLLCAGLLSSSQLGLGLMNWLAPLLVAPRLLPRLNVTAGIGPEWATLVVVPTILSTVRSIDRLLEGMQVHQLANRDAHLYFGLLTDFRDAATAEQPDDAALLDRVRTGIELLNRAHGPNRFFLFHRPRRWNEQEGVWMGHERKRGKLEAFNGLLRGRGRESFAEVVGDLSLLPEIRFVITLDTDTQLPRDAARRLVGTMAHPLNRPRLDADTGIVTEGYGILQPRVGVSLPSASRSWFVRLFAGDAGIDPYTRAVSDVYQDVFNEGSFIGKGIYDVDAFDQAVGGRFPDNTILSHDLIESGHARSALVSDVELYEDYPSRYNADINRRHRWIRGDWQIAPWLLPRVPGADARWVANPLSGLSRWKLFDNLRRSLVPLAFLLLLLGDWLLAPQVTGFGPLMVGLAMLLPAALGLLVDAVRKPEEWPLRLHLRVVAAAAARQAAQSGLSLAFLPYDAWVSLDAVLRTLVRLLVTRRHLLEWQTSSDAEQMARTDVPAFFRTMWIAPTAALVIGASLIRWRPDQLGFAAPFLVLWMSAPVLAWWISRPCLQAAPELTAPQRTFLRRIARQTWSFFETLVTAGEQWLPPDNFQEVPVPVVAGRTSPTNLGLALLANLAARDFGYISLRRLVQRTADALESMERLERHRGHFYNWYDTRSRQPLPPLYVSTVDSGNLAGHLLILEAGLRQLCDQPPYQAAVFAGLRDTLELARGSRPESDWPPLFALLDPPPATQAEAVLRLDQLRERAAPSVALGVPPSPEAQDWLERFQAECHDHAAELRELLPGAESIAPEPMRSPVSVATLRQMAGDAGRREGALVPPAILQARALVWQLEDLARRCVRLAEMDFAFLFDPQRELFTIGYNVSERRRDPGFYDLLASESRLGSFVAIAQGQVPQEHWFALGRLLGDVGGEPALMSWSGSMFEYLMPLLVMPTYENTLLDRTCRAVVEAQIRYGRIRGIPWGISESGYDATDSQSNYQYRAFGVPGLGFKRGLAEDLVIAPYASLMALMVDPRAACDNLERLAAEGRTGRFGFYEAIDYTASRLPAGQTSVTVRSFMAHHQGMGLLALAGTLLDRPMQRRFLAQPSFRATELLLQERMPRAMGHFQSDGDEQTSAPVTVVGGAVRLYTTPHTAQPEVHLLSNGRYHVMISQAGGGSSRWGDLAVTRWHEDPTRDGWGSFCYVREVGSNQVWSAAFQPSLRLGARYEAIFTQGRAEFRQRFGEIELHTEIGVSPEDDLELRRLTLTNHGTVSRTLEITTYAEVVLAPAASDTAHPAFSNLFVQTEYDSERQALLCHRRARSESERPPWLVHVLNVHSPQAGEVSHETDRARFLGRGRTVNTPAAMEGPLSGTTGAVLDPIVSLRRTVVVAADDSVSLDQILGIAPDRMSALALAEKYNQPRMADRLFELAWTQTQVALRQLECTPAEAQEFGVLAGALVQANPARRAGSTILLGNRRGQSGLWSYGISGDLPILLLRLTDPSRMDLVQRAVRAHSYWRLKGLLVELVILHQETSIYRQSLQDQIVGFVSSSLHLALIDKPGGIFVRALDQLPPEDRLLLQAVARVVLSDELGTFSQQVRMQAISDPLPPLLGPRRPRSPETPAPPVSRPLIFFNGLGGFTPDGREYIITLEADPPREVVPPGVRFAVIPPWHTGRQSRVSTGVDRLLANGATTPAPWSNVLANPFFGTVISETGGTYTWLENSHEFRLTPWNNDPVSDPPGEAIYVRDEETGEFWSPTPQPARGLTPYTVRHGFGYTVFEHTEQGIVTELHVYVAPDAPVKFSSLRIRNVSGRPRRLTVTGYWEWVLGDARSRTALHVQTQLDPKSGALLARNPFNTEFAERVAFVDVDDPARTLTGDRREFLGRNGTLARPAALERLHLSGRTGAGFDPCAALQVVVELTEGEDREVTFRLGAGRSLAEVQYLVQRFRRPNACRAALESVWATWNRTLGTLTVETPDPAVNVLANGWLIYQTLSARIWGRTGFYQSGGAFGFRDQLQDAMALVQLEPALLREQLLRAASRQFREGDVQHWWHPPGGRGVRTRISDDYLWLPYAACRYVGVVNDTGVLDESIPYLEGRALKPDEESYYDLPDRSEPNGTLYEHCVRAINHALRFGEHGLPLMGSGDWNDGCNLVGVHGRGESVWLGFFLAAVLADFAVLARRRNDEAFAERCLLESARLRENLELHAWDGEWYLRAWFDDGTPLGSHASAECQIDSLPQSWSVLSGAGDPERSRQAMQAVRNRLVRSEGKLIQLFDPPFDRSGLNPGYIRGYLPGVRENGGQYTHAALWSVMALAELGEHETAWELCGLLNPVNHASTPAQVATYKVEPYVVAADVYAVEPHLGRGGWTWYTGSAGWMYRLLTETLLGLHREGDWLRLQPRLPAAWPEFTMHYRYRETPYRIHVTRPGGSIGSMVSLVLDGARVSGDRIPLVNDQREHSVDVLLSDSKTSP